MFIYFLLGAVLSEIQKRLFTNLLELFTSERAPLAGSQWMIFGLLFLATFSYNGSTSEKKLVPEAGFKPTTFGMRGRRANHYRVVKVLLK